MKRIEEFISEIQEQYVAGKIGVDEMLAQLRKAQRRLLDEASKYRGIQDGTARRIADSRGATRGGTGGHGTGKQAVTGVQKP